jgi:hypothetical protein
MPRPAEDYDPSKVTTESLAADVADEALEYPEGTPVLIPLLALPRMRRADAYEALGHISAQQKAVRTLDGEPVEAGDDASDDGADDESDEDAAAKVREIDPATYGAQYRVVAYVEQYLRAVAANAKAFDAWALRVSDPDLITTFNVYLRKTQPGEAESSAG